MRIWVVLCAVRIGGVAALGAPATKWLIVGGGPHGVHIAARLLRVPGVGVGDLRIVDAGPALLHRWKRRAAATGMTYLRSTSSSHVDVREDGLRRFAGRRDRSAFAPDYARPRLDVFNAHADRVVARDRLAAAHVRATVEDVFPAGALAAVAARTSAGGVETLYAENVVLALGDDRPAVPPWVDARALADGRVAHAFDGDPFAPAPRPGAAVAIVGGGVTAAHLALSAASTAGATVDVLSRGGLPVERPFDVHPDWMMTAEAAARSEAGGGAGRTERQRRFERLGVDARRAVFRDFKVPE